MARHKVKNQWFVSVAVPKQGRVKAFARRTETFPTETDAKQFAKQTLSETEKQYIVAGTLRGGYLPVPRIISGSQLHSWVGALEPIKPAGQRTGSNVKGRKHPATNRVMDTLS
jgi:hypothetical protein